VRPQPIPSAAGPRRAELPSRRLRDAVALLQRAAIRSERDELLRNHELGELEAKFQVLDRAALDLLERRLSLEGFERVWREVTGR